VRPSTDTPYRSEAAVVVQPRAVVGAQAAQDGRGRLAPHRAHQQLTECIQRYGRDPYTLCICRRSDQGGRRRSGRSRLQSRIEAVETKGMGHQRLCASDILKNQQPMQLDNPSTL
jgi:hypothetical protein